MLVLEAMYEAVLRQAAKGEGGRKGGIYFTRDEIASPQSSMKSAMSCQDFALMNLPRHLLELLVECGVAAEIMGIWSSRHL